MKVELILSNTYVCLGKVYNNKVAYEVSAKVGRHLLAQANERNVPYFRKAADSAQAHLAPKKSVNKGGIPIPVEDELTDPDPAEEETLVVIGEGGADPVPAEDDDTPDAGSLNADGEEDDPEEAITV